MGEYKPLRIMPLNITVVERETLRAIIAHIIKTEEGAYSDFDYPFLSNIAGITLLKNLLAKLEQPATRERK